MRFLLLLLIVGLLLGAGMFGVRAVTEAQGSVQLLTEFTVAGSRDVKAPQVAAGGDLVHLSGNAERSLARYWVKPQTATSFGDAVVLGDAEGQPDFSTTAVALGADGSVYYVWLTEGSDAQGDNDRIFLRRKAPGQDWGPAYEVVGGGADRVFVDVAVAPNGAIFVVWSQDTFYRYRFSVDGGVTWSGIGFFGGVRARGAPSIAAGANNLVAVAYGGENGKVYVSIWNGSEFITRFETGGIGFDADPTVTIDPRGVIYAAWRNVQSGIFYTERQPDGSWPIAFLAAGAVFGPVSIAADPQNSLHVFWSGDIGGGFDLYHAYRPFEGNWVGPLRVPNNGRFISNVRGAAGLGARSYGHAAAEEVTASGLATRYYLFSAPPALVARPLIEGGAIVTSQPLLRVAFTDVSGNPAQVRWRWGAPPTDAATDSGGWQPFANPLAIPPPAGLNPAQCHQLTLYTQVRTATVRSPIEAAGIIFDPGVQAGVGLVNSGAGSSDFINTPAARLIVDGGAECSTLTTVAISDPNNPTQPAAVILPIDGNQFNNLVALPFVTTLGPAQVRITVSDSLGNTASYDRTLTYDPVAPQLVDAGSLTLTPDPRATILQTLTISGTVVRDNLYESPAERGYWGIQIANSLTPDPTGANLTWATIPVSGSEPWQLTWSLATNLPADELRPRTFYVYLRFIDAAGNPTTAIVPFEVPLTEVTLPTVYMPLVAR